MLIWRCDLALIYFFDPSLARAFGAPTPMLDATGVFRANECQEYFRAFQWREAIGIPGFCAFCKARFVREASEGGEKEAI
jgi:hypothetical protein